MLSSATSSGLGMVLGFSAVQTITDGTLLFRQGDRPQSASFLVSGWVIGVRVDRDGRERGVALYPPGSLPGLAELYAGQEHSETAIALSSCRLRRINAQTFFNLIETDPQFSEQIFRSFIRQYYVVKICSAQSGIVSLRLRSEQLFWQLLRAQSHDIAMPNGMRGECKLLAPAHNKCLAQMLGVSRESFSRTLGEMEKEGILSRRNGWRIFLDPERLWHAPEIESLVESNRGPIGHFTLTDPIYA